MRRRKFLKIIGGTTALGMAGTYIWAAPTATSARQPWQQAGQYNDPIRHALSYAILAANPHNRQPWLVELHSENEATLYCDQARHLPVTDPFDRQITIGLGCFLEQLSIAAAYKNKVANTILFEQGSHDTQLDLRPVAHIQLVEGNTKNADLFPYIINRRTDRTPYTDAVPNRTDLIAIQTAAGPGTTTTHFPPLVANIQNICAEAARIEFMTPYTHEESAGLMRVGRQAVTENPDGISIEGPIIELLNLGGAMSPSAMRDHSSTAFRQGMNMYLEAIDTTQSFVWITTPTNSRVDQIAAGRAYARANLKATQLGISMQPLSQCLQEYPEMDAQLAAIHKLLSMGSVNGDNRIQMLVRMGYGKATTNSPRWPLETRLK